MDTLTDDPARKLVCVGGVCNISRRGWHFADSTGLEDEVKASGGTWVSDITPLSVEMGEIQRRLEDRGKGEAELVGKPKTNSREGASGTVGEWEC